MRKSFALLAGLLLAVLGAVPAAFAQQSDRVALVIGNAAYPDAESPLKEPVSDARALGDELKRLGYEIIVGQNLKKEAMQQALDRFYGKIKGDTTAVVFFSGFGIQVDRQSYLIPVDAQIWNEADVRRDGFSLDKIIGEMNGHGARVKIAIVDASRRNPFERRFRSVSAGLAAVTAPRGTVVMSSAPPDTVVTSGNSPVFVPDLIKELKGADTKIENVFNRTRVDVSRATKGQQVPWFSSSLEEDYAFAEAPASNTSSPTAESSANPPPATTSSGAGTSPTTSSSGSSTASAESSKQPKTSPDPEAAARHDYVLAEDAGTLKEWDDFLTKHKSGVYHDLALDKRAKLAKAEQKSAKTAKVAKPEESGDEPTDLVGFYRRGQHRALDGDYMGAIDDFSEVINRDPKHAGALNDRCWARAVVGDLYHAMKDCDEALRIAPKYGDALDSRGLVNLKLGEFKKSIADYDAALQIDPKHASSLYGLGIAKERSGDADDGKQDIAQAKSIDPKIEDEFRDYGVH